MVEESHYPFLLNTLVLGEFMKVQEEGSDEWIKMDLFQIGGFTYQDGNEYLLRVKKTFLANPPADGASIRYELMRILSQEKVDKEVFKTKRFYIFERSALVSGMNLMETERKKIEEQIEAGSSKHVYWVYKFIYTTGELSKGKVVLYMDNSKKEGTFESTADRNGYTLNVDGIQMIYQISRAYPRSEMMIPYAFLEDVTDQYKAEYPNLEQAFVQLKISTAR